MALMLAVAGCGDAGGQTTGGSGGATETGAEAGTPDPETASTPTEAATAGDGTGAGTSGEATAAGSSTAGAAEPGPTATGPAGSSSTSAVDATCGDGELGGDETCDDGPGNGPGQACKADCTLNVCGDGDRGPGEACDHGDANGPDDACSAGCEFNGGLCGEANFAGGTLTSPIDIILSIDNSLSMSEEIQAIQDSLNDSLSAELAAVDLDYRIILVSRHGSAALLQSVCIEAPLGGIAPGGCADPPPQPVLTPGLFYHYSVEIGSYNMYEKLIDTFDKPDEFGLAPSGWGEWLRVSARKSFILVTDYTSTNAKIFQNWLQLADSDQFGVQPDIRYDVHTLIGVPAKDPPETPYTPDEPLENLPCPTANDSGLSHQTLSKLTGGLRFPVCYPPVYAAILQQIAAAVVEQVPIVCTYPLPDIPPEQTLDPADTQLEYQPGVGMPVLLTLVAGPDACVADGYYFESDQIVLCPDACATIQGDVAAEINIQLYCAGP